MVFAPLRCPNLFRFPFACLRAALSNCFAHRFYYMGIFVFFNIVKHELHF